MFFWCRFSAELKKMLAAQRLDHKDVESSTKKAPPSLQDLMGFRLQQLEQMSKAARR